MAIRLWVDIQRNHFGAVTSSLRPQANQMSEKYVTRAQQIAKTIVPVRTGHLKGSISVTQTGPMEFEASTDVHYARFVEWGTRYMRAQPFMAPAAQTALLDVPRLATQFGIAIDTAALTGRVQR